MDEFEARRDDDLEDGLDDPDFDDEDDGAAPPLGTDRRLDEDLDEEAEEEDFAADVGLESEGDEDESTEAADVGAAGGKNSNLVLTRANGNVRYDTSDDEATDCNQVTAGEWFAAGGKSTSEADAAAGETGDDKLEETGDAEATGENEDEEMAEE